MYHYLPLHTHMHMPTHSTAQHSTNKQLTNNVSDPPTILRPRPILSLLISIVDSAPGVIGAVAGSTGGSSINLQDEDGEIDTGDGAVSFPNSPVKYCFIN